MKKHTNNYRKNNIHARNPYPNAATSSYRINRIVDYLLTGATTLGIVVTILFLFTL